MGVPGTAAVVPYAAAVTPPVQRSGADAPTLPALPRLGLWRVLGESALVALAALVVLIPMAGLRGRDLDVPFEYSGDANFYAMLTKGMIEHNSPLVNPSLGAPFRQELFDLPQGADNLQFLELGVIGHLTGDWALTLNLVYILGFPAVALSAYWVTRRLRFGVGIAFVVAICYAYLPFHFVRGPSHLLLVGYWSVPLGILCCLRVIGTHDAMLRPRAADDPPWWRPRMYGRTVMWMVIAALVISSASTYYSGFTVALVTLTATLAAMARRDARVLVAGALIAIVIVFGLLANNAPSIVEWARHGFNDTTERGRRDTELYGLRVTQLVLPTTGHRVTVLGKLGDLGTNKAALPSEIGGALGVIGALGFAAALFEVLRRPLTTGPDATRAPPAVPPPNGEQDNDAAFEDATLADPHDRGSPPTDDAAPYRRELRALLAEIVIVCLLLAVIGGFAFLLALAGFTFVRGWNRISVFIGFASFLVVATWLAPFTEWIRRRWSARWLVPALLVALAAVGVLDGTPRRPLPPESAIKPTFESDESFVTAVEAALPPGASVFQLPAHPFPEAGPRFGLVDYDPVRGYLHSKNLKWSYGGMKGRESDWQDALAKLPMSAQLDAMVATGFDAVWLDRAAYADRGAAIEAELRALLGPPIAESRDGRFAVWDLQPYAAATTQRLGTAGLEQLRQNTLAAR